MVSLSIVLISGSYHLRLLPQAAYPQSSADQHLPPSSLDESMPPSRHAPRPAFTTPCRDIGGIDALKEVASQILADVRTLYDVATLPRSSRRYYADQLHSLYASFRQGLVIIGGLMNASAPINHRLPPELLTKIFALSPRAISHSIGGERQLAYWPFKTEVNVRDLHKLTKVCRYWRDLAIATPTLWTTISIASRDGEPFFRRSVYLPNDPSLTWIVHFNLSHYHSGTASMLDFMLKNAPSIREFHAWDTTTGIQGYPSFLQKFDARTLEHCTLLGRENQRHDTHPLSETTRFLPFFSDGGPRLRSLCLTNPHVLPANTFPALTLLLIASDGQSHITMEDLFRFLAGCPQLEEAYVYNIQRNSSHTHSLSSPAISLPPLKYLYYTYDRRYRDTALWEDGDPIEYLLSRTSIPPTCYMYFNVDGDTESIRHHVQEKDAVSRIFLQLTIRTGPPALMQLVFSQGSLCLEFGYNFCFTDALPSLAPFFSKMEDVRVRYTTALENSLARDLSAAFSNLKVLSFIRQTIRPATTRSESADRVHPLHRCLAQMSQPSESESTGPPTSGESEADRVPGHPQLDTLRVSVASKEEIVSLGEMLADRTALGFPIRCVVIHHCFEGDSDSEALALLRALGENAEEVILTRTRASGFRSLREVDWVEIWLPDRGSPPPAAHALHWPDWPNGWYQTVEEAPEY